MDDKEKKALLDEFRSSGVSQARFARERGIKLSTLGYWVKQERRRAGNGNDSAAPAPEPRPAQPNLVRDLEERLAQERTKVEALQRVILVLGYQL